MPGVETARERYERLRLDILNNVYRVMEWNPPGGLGRALEDLVEAHAVMLREDVARVGVPLSERYGYAKPRAAHLLATLENELAGAYSAGAVRGSDVKPPYPCVCAHDLALHFRTAEQLHRGETGMPCNHPACTCAQYQRAEEPTVVRVPRRVDAARYKSWGELSPDERGAAMRRNGGGYRPLEWGSLPPAPEPDYGGDRIVLYREPDGLNKRDVYGREPGCADCTHGRRWHASGVCGAPSPTLGAGVPCECKAYRWPSVIDDSIAMADQAARETVRRWPAWETAQAPPATATAAAEAPPATFSISDAIARRFADAFDEDVEGRRLPPRPKRRAPRWWRWLMGNVSDEGY